MNRVIKFRGKEINTGEWVYGITPVSTALSKAGAGQFTGLHDKNGQEIYEGDIVCFKSAGDIIAVGDIQFDCGVFGAEWTHHKKNRTMVGSWGGQTHNLRVLDDIIENIEIIGNIHDNPELLKTECL